jgi:sugar phosphate isomerase/epimerase
MNRRDFLGHSLAAAAFAQSFDVFAKGSIGKFGCQLYSVRDLMPADAKGTMKQLAEMGYSYFESYSQDPFWGMAPADCKKYLADMGAKMISTHAGLPDTNDVFFENAAKGGLKYVLCPYIGPQKSKDEWLAKADAFNKNGELAKKHGIKYGYHNHDYSFKTTDGVNGQQILLDNTDPNLVIFELDMCWSEVGSGKTIEHLQQYGKRYKLCHVKQLETKSPKPVQTDLAKGIIDYKGILKEAKKQGVECFLVEQEEYPTSSILSMKSNADYMKAFKF